MKERKNRATIKHVAIATQSLKCDRWNKMEPVVDSVHPTYKHVLLQHAQPWPCRFLPVTKALDLFVLKTYSWCPTLQQEIHQDTLKCHQNSVRGKNGGFWIWPISHLEWSSLE